MSVTVTGYRVPQYLVDYGDGTGSIYNAEEDWLYRPRNVVTLASQGYWEDPGKLPPLLEELLADLNAPSPGHVTP
jgi:hypothetical protein